MLRHRAYRTVEQRRLVLTEAMSQLYQADVCDVDLITRGTTEKMGKELDQLIARSKYFGKADIKAVDTSYLEQFNFSEGFQDVKAWAPSWHKLLMSILCS
jgi:hypothetical protein